MKKDRAPAPQTTGFRGRAPSADQLDDLILMELSIRGQARLNEQRRPRPMISQGLDDGLNVRKIAVFEGWRVETAEIDRAVERLLRADLMKASGGTRRGGYRATLWGRGHARAADLARSYLGAPLQSFVRDDAAFEDIGQVEVEFLGERFVIGCIEGEEGKAIRLAERFEIDTGEVLKAVSGDLDHFRAMLMAGILTYERLEELEDGVDLVPGSDRLVTLDHNSAAYATATSSLEALVVIVRQSNSYREEDELDQERRLAELDAGRALLKSRRVSPTVIKTALSGTLAYLAAKFADAPIGEAAMIAWEALKHLLR
jgi:cell division protein ZapA (FtsZ GTPase activity inhibitor)